MASTPQFQSSLGFFGILRESFKSTRRNGKLLLPILLLVFVSFSELDYARMYVLQPVRRDFALQLAKHPDLVHDIINNIDQTPYVGALDDIREVLLVSLFTMAISWIITIVFLIATVSSSSEAYTAKVLGAKDVLLKLGKTWKSPIATSFYMALLSFGVEFLYMFSIGLTSIFVVKSWSLFFLGVIAISIPFCCIYMSTLWMVSLIVSVLEEGVGGIKAIGRAAELMKGKKLQAYLLMVLFTIFYGLVFVMTNVLLSYTWSFNTKQAIKIPFRNGFFCLLKLFMFVVYTVFYHERKTSHEEKEVKGCYHSFADGEA